MNEINKLVRELVERSDVQDKKKTSPYDVTARVLAVDGDTAWVSIPGGVERTPARMAVSAKEGDEVRVRVTGGKAYVMGNATSPPTDDTMAKAAQNQALKAAKAADSAVESAETAMKSANSAVKDAAVAKTAADTAKEAADRAVEDAAQAHEAAEAAQEDAAVARTAAGNAETSARTANIAANNALQGLSTMESVVDMVNWFNEHKTASTDTTVDPNKTYYSYDSTTGALTKIDPDGTEDPSDLGWYEMSDAIAEYVATHVASTNDGLSVLSAANGWRVLISSGGGNYSAGIYMIDPNGNIAQQTTINGVEFNTGRAVKIGDQTAYINFDGNGNINVIGANMTIGGANNQNGVLTVLDASGNTIGTWNKDGINAIAGAIGGWSIGNTRLSSSVTISDVDYETLMQSLGTSTDLARVAFAVRTKASSATTWTYPFMVRHNGKLKATDADITGTITAESGSIGGWNVDTTSLYKLTADENYRIRLQSPASPTTSNYAIRLDKKENGDWSNLFYLSYGGALYAKNATITGSVTSTSTDGIQKTTITGGTASFYYDNTLAGQFVTNRFIYHEPPAPDITYNTVTLLGGSTSSRAAEIRIQPANSRGSSDTYIDIRNLANYVPSEYRDIASNAFPEIFVHARNTLISGEYVGLLGAFLSTTESIHAGKDIETFGHLQAIHYDTSEVRVKVQNNLHNANLTVNNAGSFSLYSVTKGMNLIQMDVDGITKVRCPNGMYRPVGSVDTDGQRVGAFATPSATTLRVYAQKGTAGASYGGYITFTGTSSSDIRLKDNIKPVEVKALPLINSIEMKSFDWIPRQRDYTHQPIGMIADQIEKLDNRLVMGGGYDSDGTPNYKVIDDHYLICYLTKAVQELSAEIERMKAS